jgi:hypothetical protein
MGFLKNLKITLAVSTAGFLTYDLLNSRSTFHSKISIPLIRFFLDGEKAHRFSVKLASYGLTPKEFSSDPKELEINVFKKLI